MTYNIEIKNLVITYLIEKMKKTTISKILKLSISTVNNWSNKYEDNIANKKFLTKTKSNTSHHGLNKMHKFIDTIKTYVSTNKGCNLNDIVINATDNKLSKSTVCRILKENNISRKRIQNRIVCKDIDKIKDDRITFADNSDNNNFNEYISIDESSFCITDMQKYGYSKKGEEIKRVMKHKHNKERYSLLLAINKTEIVGYKIYSGSLNAEGYKNFFEVNKDKFVNKTVIQDNVRLHHSKIVKKYTNDNNIKMKYIPAYTPEFNPIEQVFSQIKTEFRKYDHKNMINNIENLLLVVKSNQLNNYFNDTIKTINSYKSVKDL
jgi:transposase